MNRTGHPVVCTNMMTKKLLALLAPAAAAASVVAAPGCLIVDDRDPPPPPPDPFGDIAFDWSFEGEPDCDFAGVDELDIAIFQDGQLFEQIEEEPCVGGGLILTHYFNGRYELEIDAYSRDNILLYSGGFSLRVEGGVENDAGLVVLQNINGEPPPPPPPPLSTGSAGFNWTFLYPSQAAIESCDVAGVEEIDVVMTDGIDEVRDTFSCAQSAGATFDNLVEGVWTVDVDAYGTYHGGDLHLYGKTFTVNVVGDELAELGDVVLERDDASFADVDVDWDFVGASCGSAGVSQLTLAVQRTGLDQPEDVSTVQCGSLSALRRTFVPGSYTVSLVGDGASDRYIGFASIDAAPDTTAPVTIHLAPED